MSPTRTPFCGSLTGRARPGRTARGRPVGVTVDPKGALIVADDLSNTFWRITPTRNVQPR
ncbi:hypothetical protein C1I89_10750 [Achromobacter pulmonis]|uniref:Uncharacterized protein n=1 Tax=Achromobacter pulmonis TaxID=1389932 RepID=A0A2N8KMG9_9BURK|nr:hypothetical protein C1I89_10750 [Achromobacter pulmonis]